MYEVTKMLCQEYREIKDETGIQDDSAVATIILSSALISLNHSIEGSIRNAIFGKDSSTECHITENGHLISKALNDIASSIRQRD